MSPVKKMSKKSPQVIMYWFSVMVVFVDITNPCYIFLIITFSDCVFSWNKMLLLNSFLWSEHHTWAPSFLIHMRQNCHGLKPKGPFLTPKRNLKYVWHQKSWHCQKSVLLNNRDDVSWHLSKRGSELEKRVNNFNFLTKKKWHQK